MEEACKMSAVVIWKLTECLCGRFMVHKGQSSLVSLSEETAQLQPQHLSIQDNCTAAQTRTLLCVWRTRDTQPLMEQIKQGYTTLIHTHTHTHTLPLSAPHNGLQETVTWCLKSLQSQIKATDCGPIFICRHMQFWGKALKCSKCYNIWQDWVVTVRPESCLSHTHS